MSYSYYPIRESWYNTYDLREQALGLTALSVGLGCIIAGFFTSYPVPYWLYAVAIVVEFALIISMWFIRSPTGEKVVLFLFVGVSSLVLSPTINFAIETGGEIIVFQALGITASIVLLAFAYVTYTNVDLIYMWKYLFIGLILFIIGGFFIFLFLASDLAYLIYSIIGAALFSLYLLFDLSRLNQQRFISPARMALSLYIDIIVLFQYILTILLLSDER